MPATSEGGRQAALVNDAATSEAGSFNDSQLALGLGGLQHWRQLHRHTHGASDLQLAHQECLDAARRRRGGVIETEQDHS